MKEAFIESVGLAYIVMGAIIVARAYWKAKKSQNENPLTFLDHWRK